MIREVFTLDRLRAMEPDEAAATLLVRRSDGPAAADEQALAEWLRLDEANPRAWERAQKAWSAFAEVDEDEELSALRRQARAIPRRGGWPLGRIAAAAASLLVVASSALWLVLERGGGQDQGAPPPVAATPALRYAAGDQSLVLKLGDGSRVTLDAGSVVEVAFAPERRRVILRSGGAHFDVASDTRRPFSVIAGPGEVVVLGTSFDVRLAPDLFKVALRTGRLSVSLPSAGSAPVILQPGQQFVSRPGAPASVSPIAPEDAPGESFVTFENDTLAAAAAELNRYSRMQLVVRDPSVADLRVSGTFRTGDAARFGRTLEQLHPVALVNRGDGRLEIVPAGREGGGG